MTSQPTPPGNPVSSRPPGPGAVGVPRPAQRRGGLGLGLLALGFLAWLWRDAMRTGQFRPYAVMLFGAFAVIGFALALIPGYREERLARGEDLAGLEGARLITPRWWAVLGLALAVGGGAALALWWRMFQTP